MAGWGHDPGRPNDCESLTFAPAVFARAPVPACRYHCEWRPLHRACFHVRKPNPALNLPQLSRLGGSFNCIGSWRGGVSAGNRIRDCSVGVRFWTAGDDNAVRGNVVSGFGKQACDYSGGLRLEKGVNWTTDNVPWSCNTGYAMRTGDADELPPIEPRVHTPR